MCHTVAMVCMVENEIFGREQFDVVEARCDSRGIFAKENFRAMDVAN